MPERVITNIEYHDGTATVTLDNGDTLGMVTSVDTFAAVSDLTMVALEAHVCRKPLPWETATDARPRHGLYK